MNRFEKSSIQELETIYELLDKLDFMLLSELEIWMKGELSYNAKSVIFWMRQHQR